MQTFNGKIALFCLSLGLLLNPVSALGYGNFSAAQGCSTQKMLACQKNSYSEDGTSGFSRLASLEQNVDSRNSNRSELPAEAVRLKDLAEAYEIKGDFKKAETLYLRSLDVINQTLGEAHPIGAFALINLADLYIQMDDYQKAEPLYLRSLMVINQALGPDHFFAALALNNIAGMYKNMGEYSKAETMYLRSLHIHEKSLGPEHPNVAIPLNNLAELYRLMGKDKKAQPYFLRAKEIFKHAMDHDTVE